MSFRTSFAIARDTVVGMAALVIAGVYAFFSLEIPHTLLADPVGASGLPMVYAIALALIGCVLIARSPGSRAPAGDTIASSRAHSNAGRHLRAIGLLLPGAAYLLLVSSLGYFATILLLIAAVALYAGARLNLALVSISALGAAAMWVTFVMLFKIPLPPGSVWAGIFR